MQYITSKGYRIETFEDLSDWGDAERGIPLNAYLVMFVDVYAPNGDKITEGFSFQAGASHLHGMKLGLKLIHTHEQWGHDGLTSLYWGHPLPDEEMSSEDWMTYCNHELDMAYKLDAYKAILAAHAERVKGAE